MNTKNKIKKPFSDNAFNTVLMIIVTLILIVVLYPMIYVVSSSFSSGRAISSGQVYLWPVDLSVYGYKWVFNNKLVWSGYFNSIFYTVTASFLTLIFTICAAYPLSRKNYQAKGFLEKFLTVSMLFGGGLIPTFIVVSSLGLFNNPIWMIISGVSSVTYIIIMRTFFQNNVPYELFESARIDGITDIGYLMKIVLPLSKAVISVICLYAVVGKWNSYTTPLLYLRERRFWPLQLILNEMLGQAGKLDTSQMADSELVAGMEAARESIKYALIVVAVVPMLIIYPFVQKFFEKGVTMGSVKG